MNIIQCTAHRFNAHKQLVSMTQYPQPTYVSRWPAAAAAVDATVSYWTTDDYPIPPQMWVSRSF